MISLTENESRVMDFLVRNLNEKNSINEIGRRLELSPRGIYKVLKKLESFKAIIPEKIGNAVYYRPNLDEELSRKMAEFILMQNDLNSYAKIQAEDLKPLKDETLSCILFGSVITKGSKAGDIDILLVLEKKNFDRVHKRLSEIKEMKPKKIHDIMQAKEDLSKNIKKNDEVILEIIKNGKILWGSDIILEAIKNGTSRK